MEEAHWIQEFKDKFLARDPESHLMYYTQDPDALISWINTLKNQEYARGRADEADRCNMHDETVQFGTVKEIIERIDEIAARYKSEHLTEGQAGYVIALSDLKGELKEKYYDKAM